MQRAREAWDDAKAAREAAESHEDDCSTEYAAACKRYNIASSSSSSS
jgi:hypothetical protein